ncbi:ATP-binding protein [Maricaulis sp.]|uniref:ATP-binding protein n=1 Tax=Maricaulis sp. TaxID=1486257 RepID=UPI00261D67B2|nr:ATP-binding protein [Maricaulis sp.]
MNSQLLSPSNLLLIPAVMTITLVLGWRGGAAALTATIGTYSYCYALIPAELTAQLASVDFTTVMAALCSSAIFVFVSAGVYRNEMIASVEGIRAEKAKADDANAAKTEFLANMSHEIRTPLNGVLGMAEVLGDSGLEAEQKKYVQTIKDSGRLLLATLNDILDLSKIEARELVIDPVEFDPSEMITSLRRAHSLKARERGLEFAVNFLAPMTPDAKRTGDPHRISQILHNLLSNAVKFTESGSVQLDIGVDPEDHDRMILTVSDTGRGMSRDQLDSVFDPFVQAENSTSREFGGTGLGLAIVSRLVELMDGTVDVASEEGRGTRFRIELPLPRVETAPARAPKPAAAPSANDQAGGPAILIVDDNMTNRMVLGALLRPLDGQIAFAENGAEAVDACTARPFDIIFMDIRMPLMDGVEATRRIRAMESQIDRLPAPIIANTANVMEHQIAEYEATGFNAVLAKPVKQDELLDVSKELLEGDRAFHVAQSLRRQA